MQLALIATANRFTFFIFGKLSPRAITKGVAAAHYYWPIAEQRAQNLDASRIEHFRPPC